MAAGDVAGATEASGDSVPAVALNLPGGLLVYAKGEDTEVVHCVRHAGRRLEVEALDLPGSIGEIHARIGELARRVRALRHGVVVRRVAA